MYHFVSGYTAKVAGTEMGITEPVPTFSACFGEAFLPLHPMLYADMLAEKMKKFGCKAWLVNTGWSGGAYGEGKRMSLKVTRTIIDAIHEGGLDTVEYEKFPIFNFEVPVTCPGVERKILFPKNTWKDPGKYDETLNELGASFAKNFKTYADKATKEVLAAGPTL